VQADVLLLRKLVEAGRKLSNAGVVIGPGGNLSIRVGNIVYIKKSGACIEDARASDYVGVDILTNRQISGKGKPSCETSMHLGCYKARADIKCVMHTHGPYAIAYGMQKKTLKAFFPDQDTLLGEVPVLPFLWPGSKEMALQTAAAIKNHNAVFLANHGLLAVGANSDEAYYRTMLSEMSVKTLIAAGAFGGVKLFNKNQLAVMAKSDEGKYRREVVKKRV
jgi:L-fuculose-phosphate aldolase